MQPTLHKSLYIDFIEFAGGTPEEAMVIKRQVKDVWGEDILDWFYHLGNTIMNSKLSVLDIIKKINQITPEEVQLGLYHYLNVIALESLKDQS